MDPQAFVRVSVGSLGLRLSSRINSTGTCEIRLCGSAPQSVSVPLISSSAELHSDRQTNISNTDAVFYIEESRLSSPAGSTGCLRPTNDWHLEIAVYTAGRSKPGLANCGSSSNRKNRIGTVRLDVVPGNSGAGSGKPVLIHNGWYNIGGKKAKLDAKLHLRVRVESDPRYVFRFEDATVSSPQVVQMHQKIVQPIFSCRFSCDTRRASQVDGTNGYSWGTEETEQKHTIKQSNHDIRKGWKVVIHDLSGSAVAAAFMSTPFVPSNGLDQVSRSNPGAFLILRPDPAGLPGSSWHPWARLEAWRDQTASGSREAVCLRLKLLLDGHETGVVLLETCIQCDKGGEFTIDMDSTTGIGGGGYVMSCKITGEGGGGGKWQGPANKAMPLVVQLAVRHVTCVEDAAVFVALAAAVDLSVKACQPFRRKPGNGLPCSSNDL